MKSSEKRGVLYLALGEEYKLYTIRSISNLRRFGYLGLVRVIADTSEWNSDQLGYELVRVPKMDVGFGSRYYKTKLIDYGFDTTLFLDSDTLPIAPINRIWRRSIRADFSLCLDLHPNVGHVIRNSINDPERRRPEYELMIKLRLTDHPYFNSGVMLFRRCEETLALFNVWHEEWKRFGHEDQLALVRAIAECRMNVGTLDSNWNRRPKSFDSIEQAQGAGVKILHFLSRQRPLWGKFK